MAINNFTVPAIKSLGNLIGQVTEVAFDPERSQLQATVVRFQYEKIQKRCYECQRLTHEKDVCPVLVKKRQDDARARRLGKLVEKPKKALVLKVSVPLFGVLREDQVGLDSLTGRPRIVPEVLEGMRQYLMVANGEDLSLKVDRVKKSVGEVEKDPVAQSSILRLESPPIIHREVNKDKGNVFSYESESSAVNEGLSAGLSLNSRSAAQVDTDRSWLVESSVHVGSSELVNFLGLSQPFQCQPSAFRTGFSEAGPSGFNTKKNKTRKRPSKNTRKFKLLTPLPDGVDIGLKVGLEVGKKEKRKAVNEGTSSAKTKKLNSSEVIPKGGLPNAQLASSAGIAKDWYGLKIW